MVSLFARVHPRRGKFRRSKLRVKCHLKVKIAGREPEAVGIVSVTYKRICKFFSYANLTIWKVSKLEGTGAHAPGAEKSMMTVLQWLPLEVMRFLMMWIEVLTPVRSVPNWKSHRESVKPARKLKILKCLSLGTISRYFGVRRTDVPKIRAEKVTHISNIPQMICRPWWTITKKINRFVTNCPNRNQLIFDNIEKSGWLLFFHAGQSFGNLILTGMLTSG